MPEIQPCQSDASPLNDEIERLRQDVRALRAEVANREPMVVRSGPRALMVASSLGALVLGGTMLIAGAAIRLPTPSGWTVVAEQVSAQAAVGIVERIFTVY